MKTSKLLLPYGFKRAGWWILAMALVLVLFYMVMPESIIAEDTLPRTLNDFRALFGMSELPPTLNNFVAFYGGSDIVSTFIGLLLLVGGVFIGFSRNRDEDEYIAYVRYESLIIALYANSLVLLVSLIFVWGIPFLYVMLYNMFTALYIFIVFFYVRIWFNKRFMRHEE